MELYLVMFYNRYAQQPQAHQISARNEFHAGREFYRKYNRQAYGDCIEVIQKIEKPKTKLLELLNVYYGYEAQNLTELINDINEEYVEPVPDHMQHALRYLLLRTGETI